MWLSGLKVVLADGVLERGSIHIEGGKIAEVIDGDPPVSGWQCQGLTAIPGIIDLHGDMIEREMEPRPGTTLPVALALYELDKRLAVSGITTAYSALSFADGPGLRTEQRSREIIELISQHRPHLLVDTRVHARFEVTTPEAAPDLETLLHCGQVHLVSLMDHTPGQGQFRSMEAYLTYYRKWLGADTESVRMAAEKRMKSGAGVWEMGAKLGRLAREMGLPVASHDDDTPHKVETMHTLGASISEFPVNLEAAQAAKAHGLKVLMGAPNALRGGSHSGNLSATEAILEGLVDGLCTDYYPPAMLQAAYHLFRRGLLPLHKAIALITSGPAEAAGLSDRGRIAPGANADLVLVEEANPPRIRATLRLGRFIFHDGVLQIACQPARAS